MKKKADSTSTRERLLAAALHEFSTRGHAGARVANIARKCRVNKQLLYYYFKSKEGLYRAVLADLHKRNELVLVSAPSEFEASLLYWQEFYLNDPHYIRLMMWEALDFSDREVPGEADRRNIYTLSKAKLANEIQPGKWPLQLSRDQAMITWIAIVAFPAVFPQITRLITGRAPGDKVFREKRSAFLREFARLLITGDLATAKSAPTGQAPAAS